MASAANASHPGTLPEGEAFLSASQSPHLGLAGDRHPGGDPGPRPGEIFTPELILSDQDGRREGLSMASAWQAPADFAAHFPGGTQSAVPGTLASRRRPGHPLGTLPPGTGP